MEIGCRILKGIVEGGESVRDERLLSAFVHSLGDEGGKNPVG